jgi:hypothetical protein
MKMLWGAKQVVELGWVVEVGREKLPGSPVVGGNPPWVHPLGIEKGTPSRRCLKTWIKKLLINKQILHSSIYGTSCDTSH